MKKMTALLLLLCLAAALLTACASSSAVSAADRSVSASSENRRRIGIILLSDRPACKQAICIIVNYNHFVGKIGMNFKYRL